MGLVSSPIIELVRRTVKGEYVIQFVASAWDSLQVDRTITLPSFGRWSRQVADLARRPCSTFVLQEVPKSLTPDQVARDLLHCNGDRWRGLKMDDLHDVRVEQLHRRTPGGDGQNR